MNVTDKYFDLLIERRVSVVVVVAAASRVARGNYKYLFGKCFSISSFFVRVTYSTRKRASKQEDGEPSRHKKLERDTRLRR